MLEGYTMLGGSKLLGGSKVLGGSHSKITFSLFLAFWHIGICLLLIASGQKKVTQNFWIGRDPPPFWKNIIKKEKFPFEGFPNCHPTKDAGIHTAADKIALSALGRHAVSSWNWVVKTLRAFTTTTSNY